MFEGWLGAEVGRHLECAACARHAEGAEAAALRMDVQALSIWEPVLDGDLVCEHQPHGVLGSALLVLLRRDQLDRAIHAHYNGYRISRRKPKYRAAIGEHLEFCALTGNEHRGLEILAEHADWLTEPEPGIAAQAEFLTGASVLLAQLTALGHKDIPVPMPPSPGPHLPAGESLTVGVLRGFVDSELDSLVTRIARSESETGRTPRYAARLRIRRLRQPSLVPFGLYVRSTLPDPAIAPPPYAEPAAAQIDVSGMEDLYALTDTLLQAGEDEEAVPALRQIAERSLAAGAPWYAARAEMNLSRVLSAHGDRAEAVCMARTAVMDCVEARLRGTAALTLATALWELDGREHESVLPALEASMIFDADERISDGALARLRAADALAFTGRRGPATGIYERAFKELEDDGFWDPGEYGPALARHSAQYARTLLTLGRKDDGLEVLERLRLRTETWQDQGLRFEVTVNTAYALRDAELGEAAFAAFLKAAELAETDPELVQMRVRCLRSAAWLGVRDDPAEAAKLMDDAGAALVKTFALLEEPARSELRLELAETHLQRAELAREIDLDGALQDAGAGFAGLRRGLAARKARGDTDHSGIYKRLGEAASLLGRLEQARFGEKRSAVERLRGLRSEVEAAGEDLAELVGELTERIDEFTGDGVS